MSGAVALRDPGVPRAFDRLDKAVAVLSAMGRPVAARLVEHFDDAERERMLRAAGTLGDLPPDALEAIVAEFESAFVAGVGAVDNLSNLEAVFERRLVDAPEGASVWDRAAEAPEALGALLEDENPQLAVLVAAKLRPAIAARMLAVMTPARAGEIVRRVAGVRVPVGDTLARVEAHLDALLSQASSGGDDAGPLTAILNELDREMADAILDGAGLPEETAARVRDGLFGFSDVPRLADEDRATLLDGVEDGTLVAALAGADEALAEAVLGSLSPRTRRMVEAQRASARPDTEAATASRRTIAARARDLASDGQLRLPNAA